ncbi:type 4a pilus biogenesis protein PilO [Candidatus Woesebacteria bacterium]|nr:type 4a pilus biogenesis protein PilO [Candidatus Woesebacteria bacterium]
MPTRQQTSLSISNFYRHPIAAVSTELLFTIVFILVLAIVAIQPTLKTMADLSKEIEDKTKLNKNLQDKVAALNTAQAEFYRWQTQLALLDTAIPNNQHTILDVKLFEKLASEKNVVIGKISLSEYPDATQPLSQKPKVNDLPISITIQGDYLSIKNFVSALLNSRRVFVINSINFSVSTSRGGQQDLTATLSMNAPYYQ